MRKQNHRYRKQNYGYYRESGCRGNKLEFRIADKTTIYKINNKVLV